MTRSQQTLASIHKTYLFLLVYGVVESGCSLVAMQRDVDVLQKKQAALEGGGQRQRQELESLRAEIRGINARLDNVLSSHADKAVEWHAGQVNLNRLSGKIEEQEHALSELRAQFAAARKEWNAQLDELQRKQDSIAQSRVSGPEAPPDRGAHMALIESSYRRKAARDLYPLGEEYIRRYPKDDQASKVVYWMGDSYLQESKPGAALGEFNRLLRQYPNSSYLGQALLGMGNAYLTLHDCVNARLAFSTCEKRFGKEQVAVEARNKIKTIDRAPGGLCEP
ncbi:tetratricopeptide repeat protein [Pajaroellobacter abortibovis]|uniref:Outer membrane lipoprotein BamD-like domain-containing protein n=1 Tax=Pajaroellobacter abortibovis TaxID=1882918 RepID=A0A1L6MYB5_9BACT|nr:outer membrane protein assembly factor BamD [Pajaroellobacter abortibovis]APS00398.1 hypothetical protein BCY86_06685 [Pajaroellobacter abortibovis]